MGFKIRLTDDIVRIAEAGGGLRLNATERSTDDLVRIAVAAKKSGATVIMTGLAQRFTEDLVRIGAAAQGNVIFEE